jgi:hypothetical protein
MKTIDIKDEDVEDFALVMDMVRESFDFSGDERAFNQEKIVDYVIEQLEPTPEETEDMKNYCNSEIKNKK